MPSEAKIETQILNIEFHNVFNEYLIRILYRMRQEHHYWQGFTFPHIDACHRSNEANKSIIQFSY